MKRVHFMGIGGAGASAVAAIARSQGFEVTGCDKVIHNEFTIDFDKDILFEGHDPRHLDVSSSSSLEKTSNRENEQSIDILAITPAITVYDPDNEEILEAKKRGIVVLTWQEFMGKYLEKDRFVIAVAGSHGKSTTTAMIGQLLEDSGLDPTVEIGAIVPKWGKNYRISNEGTQNPGQARMTDPRGTRGTLLGSPLEILPRGTSYFVTEADEYNNNFLVTHPDLAVVLNIDYDHPDFFPTLDSYKQAFYQFMLQTKGTIVANLEDKNVSDVLKNVMKHSSVSSVDFNKNEVKLDLQVPGEHYLSNAQAAFQVGLLLGIEPQVIIKSLNNFSGIGRRLEVLGEVEGATVISSFGHHPTEIKADVEALVKKFEQTTPGWKAEHHLFIIFQPHLFSRTKILFDDFVKVFRELPIESAAIIDIYPSREKDPGDISSKQLVDAINRPDVKYNSSWEELKEKLIGGFGKDDLILFMGAGDTDKWAREFVGIQND